MESMERHGHLDLDPGVRQRLLSASAATLDRLLQPIRTPAGRRLRRRRRQSPGRNIPVRTFADWNAPPPGFLEIDLVVHHGGSWWGSMIHSLVATDIGTGWTEAVPLLAREQSLVAAGLEAIGRQLPFPVKGIRLGQRQRIHQRNAHPVLRRAGHRVHPFPAVPQERPGLD